MMRKLAVLLSLLGSQTQAAEFYFCWLGNNGYSMTGQMTVAPAALNKPHVTQDDVTDFSIAGYRDTVPIGIWDMATRKEDASWVLNFDPARNAFMTPGDLNVGVSQAWNADGTARDCGNPGFGFNLGNYAQDFCLNGAWIAESGMPPETTFLVSAMPVDPQCRIYTPTS